MSADDRIWIGRDGQRYGPYSEDDVRQWMREGRLAADALAWREGMNNWMPLASLFVTTASASLPPPPMGMPPLASGTPRTNGGASPGPFEPYDDTTRAVLPAPPSLHWGLVLLFSILTLGIFGLIWPFTQANWVRKIDRKSNAVLLLGLSLACFLIGEPVYFIGIFSGIRLGQPDTELVSLGGMLLLGRWILSLVAYFSMTGSVKRCMADHGTKLEVGGVTLFFFTLFYLQANLSWVARWKNTGQTSPKPSKAVFWVIFFLLPFVLAILAAIAIPAYQSYLVRMQVA
ncbi:MAG TPA: GYF domain-containing protein [Rhodanobacter sp.]